MKTEKASVVKKAGSATSVALHREISKNEDDNAAVEGAHKLEEAAKVFTGWNREVPDAGNSGHPEKEADLRDRQRNRHRLHPIRSRRS